MEQDLISMWNKRSLDVPLYIPSGHGMCGTYACHGRYAGKRLFSLFVVHSIQPQTSVMFARLPANLTVWQALLFASQNLLGPPVSICGSAEPTSTEACP